MTKPQQRLRVQIDELWSFVDDRGNLQWVWLAIDLRTLEIVGCHIGKRAGDSAKAFWDSWSAVERPWAVCDTDFWSPDVVPLPSKRPKSCGQGDWKDQLY
ncbi:MULTISPECIES: hypothetical protein [unclassified Microcoleus]|uniref:hypothetical protein n=1 Tax=unclassified Microcoleus TaxID=2642155 RepID=UPI002FD2FB03